ncbi:MAG: hypothetical protein HY291_09600 [Planctomycetes bacterium]|nr:hypothetical protein [Planctomycetota bacterium]
MAMPGPIHSLRPRANRRAFILLVVVGLLTVLLALVVGFLAFSRAEVTSVAHLRDKTDCLNLTESAQDWMISNVCADLLDNTGKFRTAATGNQGYVSLSRGADGQWWYKMYEPGTTNSGNAGLPGDSRLDAPWIYTPLNYFNPPSVRGRFCVLILDPNMAINFNDWSEDCMPSQCQLAHMVMDAKGPQFAEQSRGTKAGLPNWGGVWDGSSWNYTGGFSNYPMMLHRYLDCWYVASRTVRFEYNLNLLPSGRRVTTNTIGFMPSQDYGCTLGISALEQGLDTGWNNSFYTTGQNYIGTYDTHGAQWAAYVDPDTGRSPVNVNTVDNSYNCCYPFFYALQTVYPRTLNAVFNIESLRRIVKVGKFRFRNNSQPGQIVATTDLTAYTEMDARVLYDTDILTNPAKLPPEFDPAAAAAPSEIRIPAESWLPAPLDGDIVMKSKSDVVREMRKYVEELRTKIAYQYQETLCRYFQAFHWTKSWYRYADGSRTYAKYRPAKSIVPYPYDYGNVTENYIQYAARVLGASEANRVKWFAPVYDDSKARFPYGIDDFRTKVKSDLIAMTVNNNVNPIASWTGPRYRGTLAKDGGEFVNFDENGTPEIAVGKFDRRTASAVWDNIVPGKAMLFPGDVPGIRDPIGELYAMRLGRDENTDKDYVSNYYCFLNPTNTGGTIPWERGMDIVLNSAPDGPWSKRANVPERQLAFGPDWFSTELTTATTTFVAIINAQIVDAASVTANPAKPRVLFHAQRYVVFEIAPDIETEDKGEDGTSTGLQYYRSNKPRLRKKDPEIMDKNCATLPADNNGSTVPKDWIDYRGVKEGDEASYYTSPSQTSRRVVIRAMFDLIEP